MRRTLTIALLLLLPFCGTGCPEPDPPGAEPAPPGGGDGRIASFDSLPIAYSVYGEGEGALVFLHGWCCDRGYWKEQVEPFQQRQKVVTIDLAGHGDSGALHRHDWTFDTLARDVETVIDHLDLQNVVLVGHSMGGPVALAAARRMPGRVLAVIGVDTFHNAEWSPPPGYWEKVLADYESDFAGTCDRFVRSMFLEDADANRVDEIAADMCASDPEIAMKLFRQFEDYDLGSALRDAGVPIRAINSVSYPTAVEVNRRYAADFDVLTMEGVGHFLHMERPDEFNALLQQWIEELTTADSVQI